MKHTKHLLLMTAMLLCSLAVSAHDFEVNGIYYNITSEVDKTVEVTYRGSSFNDYENEYSGVVAIPATVTYGDITYGVTSIGNKAFYGCSSLTSITLPEGVTSIGNNAFRGCRGLTSFTLPKSVASIGSYAFWECSSLTSIIVAEGNMVYDSRNGCNAVIENVSNELIVGCSTTIIPESVTSIGSYAFYGCGLTSITIPESVRLIYYGAFSGCSSLTSITVAEGNIVYDSRGGCNAIIKTGSNELIAGCSTTIIPESVTRIGYKAFQDCSNLASITLPKGVTSIGPFAFQDCSNLTSITLPESLTSIGNYPFQGCSSLTSITCHAAEPTVIGSSQAFFYVDKSIPVYVPASSLRAYKAAVYWKDFTNIQPMTAFGSCGDNLTWKLTSAGELIIEGSGDMYDYSSKNDVPWYEYRESIKTITILEGVTSIGDNAFFNCSSLTSIAIPQNVTSIGYSAFSGCSNLISVTIPEGVTNIGHAAFSNCNKLTSIKIPRSLTSLGQAVFSECYGLSSIILPEGLTTIDIAAFINCTSLQDVYIPSSVTTIKAGAFSGCSNIKSIICAPTAPPTLEPLDHPLSQVFYGVPVNDCILYVAQESSNDYKAKDVWKEFANIQPMIAFGFCGDNLTWELTDAGELIIEGSGDMYDYSSRSDVPWYEYRESIKTITILGGVTGIGDHAFDGCRRFTSVALPESVTKIGQRAFHGCRSLTSITISRNVVSIGDAAFTDCDGLTTLVVEDGNQVYDSRSGCNAIIETSTNTLIAGCGTTVIPESVTGIGVRAFQSCSSLTSITIPRNVVSIGDVAFTFCDGLTTLVVEEGNQVYDSRSGCNAIIETNTNTLIAGCSTTVIPDGVTAIGAYAFYGCETLTSITVPEGVTVLGDFAFQFCEALEQLSLPSTLEHIGWAAISHCEVLGEIALPSNVRTIDSYAFDYTGMTSITIPEGVDKIAYAMFSNCSNLASIVIPGSVSLIEEHALEECSELTAIICNATTPPTVESANTFTNVPRSIPVYVPASSVEAYKAADYWNEFANIIGTDEDGNIVVEDAWESYANAEAKKNNGIAYTRNFRNTNWQALYVPFEIPVTEELLADFDVACIHDVYQNDNNTDGVGEETIVEVRKVKSGTLDANYPYLIRAKEEGEKTITVAEAMLYATQETSIEYSLAFGTYTFTGTYSRLSAAELAGCYALSSGIFQPIADGASLGAFRFYMKIESRDGNAQAARNIRMRVVGDDDATGMEMTSDDSPQTAVVYDLQGRRVVNPTKGIYIVNGKKRLF